MIERCDLGCGARFWSGRLKSRHPEGTRRLRRAVPLRGRGLIVPAGGRPAARPRGATSVASHFLRVARDERGGIGFNLLWVCFVLLFMVPFFWDVASVHYARRFAGTGSDAASLAAAQEYARRLHYVPTWNGIFYGRCELGEYTPQQVVLRYLTNPAFGAPAGIGEPYARQYAINNRNNLTTYRSWPDYSIPKMVAGIPIPVIKVYVETEREVFTAYGPLYRREFEAPNRALAVAYLDTWQMMPRPCGQYATTYDFMFHWKITLDKAR